MLHREGVDRLVGAAVHLVARLGGPGVGLGVAVQVQQAQPQRAAVDRPLADGADHVAARPLQQHGGPGHVDRHDLDLVRHRRTLGRARPGPQADLPSAPHPGPVVEVLVVAGAEVAGGSVPGMAGPRPQRGAPRRRRSPATAMRAAGWNRHPAGGERAGQLALEPVRRVRPSGPGTGTADSSAIVYGCSGGANSVSRVGQLDDAPEVHHRHPVAQVLDDAQVVGHEQQRPARGDAGGRAAG